MNGAERTREQTRMPPRETRTRTREGGARDIAAESEEEGRTRQLVVGGVVVQGAEFVPKVGLSLRLEADIRVLNDPTDVCVELAEVCEESGEAPGILAGNDWVGQFELGGEFGSRGGDGGARRLRLVTSTMSLGERLKDPVGVLEEKSHLRSVVAQRVQAHHREDFQPVLQTDGRRTGGGEGARGFLRSPAR